MNSENKTILITHGAGKAYYNRLAMTTAPAGSPTLTCACGWLPTAIFETWEEAGAALDRHIKDSLREQGDQIKEMFADAREARDVRESRGELLRERAAAAARRSK